MSHQLQIIPLDQIHRSSSNPRKHFDEAKLQELADSIKSKGVLQPIVVRPNKKGFEVVAGERRFRASKLAEQDDIPAIVRELTDEEVLEIQVIENSQREDVHPMEEAQGFKALLASATYTALPAIEAIETLAGKLGKSTSHVYQRLKLLDLTKDCQKEFLEGNLTAGHAVDLARLQPAQQKEALNNLLFHTDGYGKRTNRRNEVMSVRAFRGWIQEKIFLNLSAAPWKKDDLQLLPQAGSCAACAKRTGANPTLFGDMVAPDKDCCTDPICYKAKGDAFIDRKFAELGEGAVRISLAHGGHHGILGTDRYKEASKKSCDHVVHGFVVELGYWGNKSDLYKVIPVCTEPKCKVHWQSYERQRAEEKADPEAKAKRREQLRGFKAEILSRHRILEACLEAIGESGYHPALRENFVKLLGVAATKLVTLSSNSVCDSKDFVKHPGRNAAFPAMGLPRLAHEGHYNLNQAKLAEALVDRTPNDVWKGILTAATYDEISYGDYRKPEAFVLLTFAEALEIDVELIRKESDWDTLSKKQQKERLEATNGKPEKKSRAKAELPEWAKDLVPGVFIYHDDLGADDLLEIERVGRVAGSPEAIDVHFLSARSGDKRGMMLLQPNPLGGWLNGGSRMILAKDLNTLGKPREAIEAAAGVEQPAEQPVQTIAEDPPRRKRGRPRKNPETVAAK